MPSGVGLVVEPREAKRAAHVLRLGPAGVDAMLLTALPASWTRLDATVPRAELLNSRRARRAGTARLVALLPRLPDGTPGGVGPAMAADLDVGVPRAPGPAAGHLGPVRHPGHVLVAAGQPGQPPRLHAAEPVQGPAARLLPRPGTRARTSVRRPVRRPADRRARRATRPRRSATGGRRRDRDRQRRRRRRPPRPRRPVGADPRRRGARRAARPGRRQLVRASLSCPHPTGEHKARSRGVLLGCGVRGDGDEGADLDAVAGRLVRRTPQSPPVRSALSPYPFPARGGGPSEHRTGAPRTAARARPGGTRPPVPARRLGAAGWVSQVDPRGAATGRTRWRCSFVRDVAPVV